MNANVIQQGNEIYLRVAKNIGGRRVEEWYVYNLKDKPLGAGAMGTVYLGRSHYPNPGMKVAIKRVADQYTHIPSIRERARLEASMLFRHQHLVEMVGCCEYAFNQGPIFIISHLVQGMTLDEHVKRHLNHREDRVKRICQCFYPVLEALDYLHAKDIVHLDIKPTNIMIEHGSNIRLMDLGIAFSADAARLMSNGLIGTPQYAAPEQNVGISNDVGISPATDIYETGVSLYELLADYNPFDAPTTAESILRHQTENLPYVDGVPKAVVDVLRRATAKSPQERYQSALIFKNELIKAVATPDPVPSFWSKIGRFFKNNHK